MIFKDLLFQRYSNNLENFSFAEMIEAKINLDTTSYKKNKSVKELVNSYIKVLMELGHIPRVHKDSRIAIAEYYFKTLLAGTPPANSIITNVISLDTLSTPRLTIQTVNAIITDLAHEQFGRINGKDLKTLKGKYLVSADGKIVITFNALLYYSKAFQQLLKTNDQLNPSAATVTPIQPIIPVKHIHLKNIDTLKSYESALGIKKGCFSYPTDPIQYNPHDEFEKIHEAIKFKSDYYTVDWRAMEYYKLELKALLGAYIKAIKEVIDINNETVENTKTYSFSNQAYTNQNGEVIFNSFLDLQHATARVLSAVWTLIDSSQFYSVHPGDILACIQANADIHYNSQYNLKSISDVSDDGNIMQTLISFSTSEIENALKELRSQMQLNENNIFFNIDRSPLLQKIKIPTYYLLSALQIKYSDNPHLTIKYINHDEDEKVFDRANCLRLNCLKTEYYLRSTVFSLTPPSLSVKTVKTEDVILAEKANSTKVREIIKKICLECFGEYSYDTVLKLQGYFVLNENEGVITHGSILVKRAYSSKNDVGEPIFATKIKEPKIVSETKTEKSDRTLETLRSVVKDTTVPEGILLHALSTLGFISATPRAFETIHERIIKANKLVSGKSTQRKPTEIFEEITALAGQKIDFTDAGVLRLSDLLKQLCLRVHNGDVEKVISELREYVEGSHNNSSNLPPKLQSLIIEKVIPTLINLFKDIDDFTHPLTVQTKLYPLQVEAVIEALEYQKPIKVMGTATVKTETATVYCESLIESQKSTAVLWVTKSSSRVGACERILEKILKPELSFKVSVLGPKEISLDQKLFENFLKENRYVIVGADSLHKLRKENPENFQTLQIWLKDKIRILDEFHILDKKTSKRSMAVRELESKFTLSASATPFQHDESRIATILHTNFPETYPSIQELTLTFKRHPHLAEELLRAHSTIFQLEDLAIPFEDPSKISFEEQLMGGLPRVPTTSRKIHEVQLSRKQTEVYIDAATNYQKFMEQNEGLSNNSQVEILRKIVGNPESVGAGAPFALIEGIKAQALPVLREGKKVFISAENTALLTWLAADSELKMYGSQLLDGKMTPEERHPEIVRFEEDPSFQCLIGQVDAVGSSDNFRSTDLLIIVQPPKTIAGGIQLEGRVTRAIAQGEERFARCTVEILYIVPTLDPEVIKLVPEAHRRKVLKRGTVYDLWTKRFIARLERYKLFTSRKSSAHSNQHNSTQEILGALAKTYGEIVSSQSQFELISADSLREKVSQYNTAAKKTWRDDFLRKNILQHLEFIGKEPKDIKVALLPGPEGLELYTYLTLGVLPENIYCFEASKDEKILNMTRENVIREGCRFYSTKIETMLPQLDVPFDIISIDPNGYITPEMVTMFLKLPVNSHSLISMNTLGQREKGDSINLLNFFGGIRGNLQKALLKLIATEGKHPTKNWDGKNALLLASQVRHGARVLSSIFESEFKVDKRAMTEFLGELYFGSPHLQSIDQYTYIGKGGSRFHSTFAALSPWDIDLRESDASQTLRSILHDIVCIGINRPRRVRPSEIQVHKISDSTVSLRIGDALIGNISAADIRELLNYFDSAVRKEYLLPELLAMVE